MTLGLDKENLFLNGIMHCCESGMIYSGSGSGSEFFQSSGFDPNYFKHVRKL